jgi:hypothetical protein
MINAWPDLSEAIKVGIEAMVEAGQSPPTTRQAEPPDRGRKA